MTSPEARLLLTRQEVAAQLGVSLATVDRWITQRGLPSVQMGARMVRIPRTALDLWIADQLRRAVR